MVAEDAGVAIFCYDCDVAPVGMHKHGAAPVANQTPTGLSP